MHFLAYTPQRERFILLLWGLLFAKCFIVEHYVQAHEVPVSSWLYVWALSISMATVATLAFLRVRAAEQMPPQVPRSVLVTWVLCLAVSAVFLLGAGLTPLVSLANTTVILAVILAFGFTLHGLHSKALLDWFSAVSWWLMAGLQSVIDSEHALLGFGIGLLAFVVMPLGSRLIIERYQARAAVRALYIANDI